MGTFDQEKLKELIVFFARESSQDRFFGSTKLNKLLFIADFMAYGYLGHSITGARYVHQEQGPTPSPEQFLEARRQLIEDGRLSIREEETYAGIRKRPVSQSYPDLNLFTEQELDICRDAIETLKHMNAIESSEWSHRFPGWLYTKQDEEIPYEAAYLWRKTPATREDFEWAWDIAQKIEVA